MISHLTDHIDHQCMRVLSDRMEGSQNDCPLMDRLEELTREIDECHCIQLEQKYSMIFHLTCRIDLLCKHVLFDRMGGSQSGCPWMDKLVELTKKHHMLLKERKYSKISHLTCHTDLQCTHALFDRMGGSQSGYLWMDKLDEQPRIKKFKHEYHYIQLEQMYSMTSH
jgi:chorismate mutase